MAKLDLEKYWDFRVWVKSQIAQLRALLNDYQQNGGGGGTGGGGGSSDFNPAGTYPNMTAGKAQRATADSNGYNIAQHFAEINEDITKPLFFVKPDIRRFREAATSSLDEHLLINHPYLEKYPDTEIVLMAVKRRGGSYTNRTIMGISYRKKRKAWGELHYSAMPNTEINHSTITIPNRISFEDFRQMVLNACARIPEGVENERQPYRDSIALEEQADFFYSYGAVFAGNTPAIRLGVALRIPNPRFPQVGTGNRMWSYVNDERWEYRYLYSDVAEIVVKSQFVERDGSYVMGLEIV